MRLVLAAAVAALLSAPVTAHAAPAPATASQTAVPAWKTYAYRDLHYGADFPAEPARSEEIVKPGPDQSSLQSTFVVAQLGSSVFGVTTTDYSSATIVPDPAKLADHALNGVTSERTVMKTSSFEVPGGAGREAVASGGGLVVRVRIYAVNKRLYIVMAGTLDTAHPHVLDGGDAERFFASFKPTP
ncbi:MAG: hypothetical protein JSR45_14495 [Proteobacteria bacterium]|nr:hypothetical protein [Pseudomonadota bacterium]